MTTFVAALHLPYTVQFRDESDDPRPRTRYGSPKKTPPQSPRRRLLLHEIPSPRRFTVNVEPAPDQTTVNPLQNSSITPLATPNIISTPLPPVATPSNQEFFFKLQDGENAPLGSPSDPTITHRRNLHRNLNSKPLQPAATLNNVGAGEADQSTEGSYFASRPSTITQTQDREKRRSSASSTSFSSDRDSAWYVEKTDQGNGGLKNAVEAAEAAGMLTDKTWVGTLGFPTDGLDESTKVAIEGRLREDFDSLVAFTKDVDFDGHYNHFCKEILWPVFHYQIPDHPKSKAFLDHSWDYFEAVNRVFADVIAKEYKRGDTIWVNDYHLILVPQMLRKKLGPDAKIGLFMHVGFPSSEVFRCLAHRDRLLDGMLGATMVGFQTEEYARHFLQTCSRLRFVEAKNDGIQLENRFVNVISLPIGIDPVQLDAKRREEKVGDWIESLTLKFADKKLLVARDKLDGVRGVRQKLLAYELFLTKHPEWVGKVVLVQVALTTSSVVEVQSTVVDIVTRINCSFGSVEYQPVIYLHQDITYHQYIALLTIADSLLVTSLRDGMNLTSHEFVYLQDRKHAPLILSEFTGSASVFNGRGEISVNPWDYSRCADAIEFALTMSAEEKKQRWQKLYDVVMHENASYWCSTFLQLLDSKWSQQQSRGASVIPRLSTKSVVQAYRDTTNKRLFLLDYEGTLAVWGSPTSTILTSPQRTFDILNDLTSDPKNIVYIMSNRPPEELGPLFHRVPGIGLIAEHGCYLRPYQKDAWSRLCDKDLEWKKSVKSILEYYVERTPGSTIEEGTSSYVWHFEKAEDPTAAARQAGDCCDHVNGSCEKFNVVAVPHRGSVTVESRDWTKTTASQKALELAELKQLKVDFLMVMGDSRDDEPVFEWANELGRRKIKHVTTVKVGSSDTHAKATTTGIAGVLGALQKLAAVSFEEVFD